MFLDKAMNDKMINETKNICSMKVIANVLSS